MDLLNNAMLGWADITPFALFALIVLTLVKIWPRLKELGNERVTDSEARLTARVESLEAQLERVRLELGEERRRYEKEIQILRHRLNNEMHALDSLLMLMESAPDRLENNIQIIREQREKMRKEIALEKGAMRREDDD